MRRWVVSFTFGLTLALLGAPACQTRCYSAFDCGEGSFCNDGRCETECFVDDDCVRPPDCRDSPLDCEPRGIRCNSLGRCIRGPDRPDEGPTRPGELVSIPRVVEGWNAPPGTGSAFVVDALHIAGEERGFDLDGRCRGPGDCVDNALFPLGDLANDQIRQGILSGDTLLLIELAGLDTPFRGNDDTLTVKFYGGRDADPLFYSGNNFSVPRGETECCQFTISQHSLAEVPSQARARAPARLERGQLRSLIAMDLELTLTIGKAPHPEIRLENALVSARVPADLSRLSDGILGGSVPIASLARIDNPFCRTLDHRLCAPRQQSSRLIDLMATILQPDIDLDVPRDGLDRLDSGADGRIDRCFDGLGEPVEATDVSDPHSCTLQPSLVDGYSIGLGFSAVKASIVGIGQ